MNRLHRELAPISDSAWAALDAEAADNLRVFLAARRLMDFHGPTGATCLPTGRVEQVINGDVSVARLVFGRAAPERLYTSVASDRAPDRHAGSGRTVFVSRRSGHPELWLAGAADDPEPRPLTRLGAVEVMPRLSITAAGAPVIELRVDQLLAAWKGSAA